MANGLDIRVVFNDIPALKRNLSKLNRTAIQVGLPTRTGAGIHADSNMTMAEIGMVHEYGTEKIPQRSFIRQGISAHRPAIELGLRMCLIDAVTHLKSVQFLDKAFNRVGAETIGYIYQQFKISGSPSWEPLSPYTIAQRRLASDTPLWDTGQLVQSLTWEVKYLVR